MYLSVSEKIAKWLLLFLLLCSVVFPVLTVCVPALKLSLDIIGNFMLLLLVIAAFQGIGGLIGWFLLCKENIKGKHLLTRLYFPSAFFYALYSLFLLFMLFFTDDFLYDPLEIIVVFAEFFFSLAVILLRHLWIRNSVL